MSLAVEAVEAWVEGLSRDVEVAKAVIETEGAHREARKLAAAALAYLVTRMDLIPDWNETIGVIDDAMVLRVCLDLGAARLSMEALPDELQIRLGRLCNDVDHIKELLGADLYAKLRRHCMQLGDTAVRGHSPGRVVDDAGARSALYGEVAADLARAPAGAFTRSDDLQARLRSYLHHKLQR